MKFSSSHFAAIAAAFVGTVSATPIGFSPSISSLERRTPGGVFICENINWGPPCGYTIQPLGQGIRLGDDWNNKISSFGPDPCTLCFAYDFSDCSEASWEFSNPGDATSGIGSSNPWNDKISAFMCTQTC